MISALFVFRCRSDRELVTFLSTETLKLIGYVNRIIMSACDFIRLDTPALEVPSGFIMGRSNQKFGYIHNPIGFTDPTFHNSFSARFTQCPAVGFMIIHQSTYFPTKVRLLPPELNFGH